MTKIVFYVIVFEQIRISICQAHQNNNQNLSFMRILMQLPKKWPEMVSKQPTHWVVLFVSNRTLSTNYIVSFSGVDWRSFQKICIDSATFGHSYRTRNILTRVVQKCPSFVKSLVEIFSQDVYISFKSCTAAHFTVHSRNQMVPVC